MKLELFVPGRLCLFGEHTDWAGKYRTMNADIVPGASIVTGIEQGIYAEVEKSSIFEMYSEAPEIADVWQDFACRMNETELKNVAKSGSFFSYFFHSISRFLSSRFSIFFSNPSCSLGIYFCFLSPFFSNCSFKNFS